MSDFDPFSKEIQLRTESASWDTSVVAEAEADDIPVLDLRPYLDSKSPEVLEQLAAQLRGACEEVGFFSVVGHGVPVSLMRSMFDQVRRFHDLSASEKESIRMDRSDWPIGGVGYLPLENQKLPARDKVNYNEALLIKSDHRIGLDQNQWPDPDRVPEFRDTVTQYAESMTALGKSMLAVFSRALEMPADFFDKAFDSPMYRLRMTHYPPMNDVDAVEEFGINPHVDTTFCTILAQDRPGLVIYSERRNGWIKVPLIENAFVVNSGELLRQWTNDRFISVKHFANNNAGTESRYSVPFFFNANADYVMQCIPTCCDADNPPKYPPVSYAASQAIAQGE